MYIVNHKNTDTSVLVAVSTTNSEDNKSPFRIPKGSFIVPRQLL